MAIKLTSGFILLALIGATFFGLHRVRQTLTCRLRPDQPMPSFRLTDGRGRQVLGEAFSGKKYGLLFFRVDCGHCRQEIIELDDLLHRFNGALPVVVASLSSPEETRRASEAWGLTLEPFHGAREIFKSIGGNGVPALVLVNEQGRIAYFQQGGRSGAFLALVFERFLRGEDLSEASLRAAWGERRAPGPAAPCNDYDDNAH
jgi:peroxiredoxin